MANRERGEVSLVVGEKHYTLRPTLSAYCELEDRLNKRHTQVIMEANIGDARATRALVWSYLQAHHKSEIDTFEKAGALIDEAGLEAVIAQLKALDALNQPADDKKGKDGTANPPTAQDGAGDGS